MTNIGWSCSLRRAESSCRESSKSFRTTWDTRKKRCETMYFLLALGGVLTHVPVRHTHRHAHPIPCAHDIPMQSLLPKLCRKLERKMGDDFLGVCLLFWMCVYQKWSHVHVPILSRCVHVFTCMYVCMHVCTRSDHICTCIHLGS